MDKSDIFVVSAGIKMSERSFAEHRWPIPTILLFLSLIVGFLYLCQLFEVKQDDAYISYRYAANFLNGNGLVFNIGERIEGYTNFLWVILISAVNLFTGIKFELIARILGLVSGVSLFGFLFLLIASYHKEGQWQYFLSGSLLLLASPALPYWSTSGMESAAFALVVLGALLAEYRKPSLTPWLLAIATLLRPDGVVSLGAILLHRLYRDREFPWRLLLLYGILLLPYALFKLLYYGELLPNSFYAKSGVGLEYLASGLEYLWFYFSTAGLYGLVFLIPIAAAPFLWKRYSLLYIFIAVYLLYIVWIGGDVLKVYRFFVPVLAPLSLLFGLGTKALVERATWRLKAGEKLAMPITVVLLAGLSGLSFYRGYSHTVTYRHLEKALVGKMEYASIMLRRYMGGDFTIAASTIGMLGYALPGHRVIDMLGLTDRHIARHPENIPGLKSTWKERRFNSRYLLEQSPDFIFFSTEYKPSAPAEQALFLHSEFRKNYFPIGFPRENVMRWVSIYKRWGVVDMSRDTVLPEVGFPQNLKAGFDNYNGGEFVDAILCFEQARQFLGKDYFLLNYGIGRAFYRLNYIDSAKHYFYRAVSLNEYDWHSHYFLTRIALDQKDTAVANYHALAIARLAPWLLEEARRQGIGLQEGLEE